jgi:dTDP-4-dehydrorhamnose 3,5-epimerase
MNISSLGMAGAYLIEVEPLRDERGFFARTWCAEEFAAAGLNAGFVQSSMSHTKRRGALRGMHYQEPPSREGKLIRCIAGTIFDVIVDIRPGAATFLQHAAVELSADNRRSVYIEPGFAHGFQTLCDAVDVLYEMTDYYRPDLSRGFRFDDPRAAIEWPLPVTDISERDASYADISDSRFHMFQ